VICERNGEENERVLTATGREGEVTDLQAESVTSISCRKKERKAMQTACE